MKVVYSEFYDMLGVLEGNLVRISDYRLFIPYTNKWVLID